MKRLKNFSDFLNGISVETAVGALVLYRIFISPLLAVGFFGGCRFFPSCSEYATTALRQYGLLKGAMLSLGRIGRCHPWCAGGYDPLPRLHAVECMCPTGQCPASNLLIK